MRPPLRIKVHCKNTAVLDKLRAVGWTFETVDKKGGIYIAVFQYLARS